MGYVLISPCRNEAEYMRETLDSVIAQTIKPDKWVIVDDGSTDATPDILNEYESKYDWIQIVKKENRGKRSVGPGVVETFYVGLNTINFNQYDYLCKLDLDLRLPPRYFEILIQRMQENPRIGTCSGKAYMEAKNGKVVSEKCGNEMSVGMTKFYRTTCFNEIGGFVRQVMWDAIDCHRCRMLGWIACSWDIPELRFIHLRPMGSSQKGIFTGRMRHGYGQYFMGTGLLYMTATAVFRMAHPPYVIGGLATLWGYIKSLLKRDTRYNDKTLRDFVYRYQLRALLKGKKKAIEKINEKQFPVWADKHRI
jgi:glycosyltransferase involved in cell wall biosynthesis